MGGVIVERWRRFAIGATLLALAGVALTGCLDRTAVLCADGRVCSPGTVCIASLDRCVDPERVKACDGPGEGGDCSTAEIAIGICSDGVCSPAGCGNEVVEAQEVCDDGNTLAGDGCSADCLSTEQCGNGIVDRDEECDDGPDNSTSEGFCRLDCVKHCGDGFVNDVERCDWASPEPLSCLSLEESFDRGFTSCSSSCDLVLDLDTCKYLGWRSRSGSFRFIDVAMVGRGDGFAVVWTGSDTAAGVFTDFVPDWSEPGVYQPGLELQAVWAAGADLAVVVGATGAIARWDGAAWSPEESGTTETLHDVWGRDGDDIYAVGDGGTVLHYDGVAWTPIAGPVATALRGVSGDDAALYVVGDGGVFYRRDDSGWTDLAPATTAELRGVWSDGLLTVAVGTGATIVEVRAGVVSLGRTPVVHDLTAVWGDAIEGYFAVGDRGTLLAFDGAIWRTLSPGTGFVGSEVQDFTTVAGLAGEAEVVVGGDSGGFSFEGAAWAPTASASFSTLLDLTGSAVDDVIAVGRAGTILHHDGLTWTTRESGITVDLTAAWSVSPVLAYAVGEAGTVLRYDGAGWTAMDPGVTGDLADVWASADDDVYVAAGEGGLLHFDGVQWSQVELPVPTEEPPPGEEPPPPDPAAPTGVWGRSADDVWVFEGALAWHYNGVTWSLLERSGVDAIVGTETGWIGLALVKIITPEGPVVDGAQLKSYNRLAGTVTTRASFELRLTTLALDGSGGVFLAGESGLFRWQDGELERIRPRRTNELKSLLAKGDMIFLAGIEGALEALYFRR